VAPTLRLSLRAIVLIVTFSRLSVFRVRTSSLVHGRSFVFFGISLPLAIGGIVIAEDPTATPALYGAYLAMSEFLETEIGKKFLPIFKYGQYFLLRR
jgi:hypothetical protein